MDPEESAVGVEVEADREEDVVVAEEEVDHAGWIRHLYRRVEEGTASLNKEGFRLEGILDFLKYAEERLKEAQEEKLPFMHALDMALDLESALLERKFYQLFEADSEAMEQAFRSGQGDYVHLQGPSAQQLASEGVGHVVAWPGKSIGPVAFSSLAASQA